MYVVYSLYTLLLFLGIPVVCNSLFRGNYVFLCLSLTPFGMILRVVAPHKWAHQAILEIKKSLFR